MGQKRFCSGSLPCNKNLGLCSNCSQMWPKSMAHMCAVSGFSPAQICLFLSRSIYLCLSLNAHVCDRCHSSVPEGRGYCKIRFKPFRKQTRQTLLIELVYCCNVAGSLEVEQWEENQLSSVWGRTQTLTKSWSWWCVLSTFTAVNTAYHVRHFRDIQRFDEGHV